MKKSVWCVVVVAILLSWMAFGAWGIDSAAFAKEYQKTLKLASPMPQGSFAGYVHQWWAKELEKRTNGRVKTQFFWMESLVKWTDMLQGVASGIADVGYVAATYHPSELPLYMVVDMPGNAKDYYAGARAVTDACYNQPDLAAELEKKNIVHVGPWISGAFHLATKGTWQSLSELKGRTFRAFGGAFIDYFGLLGINPIFMSYSEIYEAMNRGTIWGNQAVLQLSDALKHAEVTKQATNAGIGFVVGGSGLALNRKVWLGMPKDIQAIMRQLDYDLGVFWAEELYKAEDKIKKSWTAKGIVVNEFSPADMKLSQEVTAKAQEKFLGKLESQGLPAKKVWTYFRGQVVKYEKEVKEKGHPWERK